MDPSEQSHKHHKKTSRKLTKRWDKKSRAKEIKSTLSKLQPSSPGASQKRPAGFERGAFSFHAKKFALRFPENKAELLALFELMDGGKTVDISELENPEAKAILLKMMKTLASETLKSSENEFEFALKKNSNLALAETVRRVIQEDD